MVTWELDPFNADSINEMIHNLDQLKNRLNNMGMKVAEKVAEVGADTASQVYNERDDDGNMDVYVAYYPVSDGYEVSASGDDVYFAEFGAGLDTSALNYEFVDFGGLDVYPGSWSSQYGTGEFAKYGSWHHDGKKYTGIMPTHAMYRASLAMTDCIDRVAMGVLNDVINRK